MGFNHTDFSNKKSARNTESSDKCFRDFAIQDKTVHAEEMAINKLLQSNLIGSRRKKKIKLSLLVIRVSTGSSVNNYKLKNSKPCSVCIERILKLRRFGYDINKIYYSDEYGRIIKTNINSLSGSDPYITTYYRNSGKTMQKYI